MRTKSITNLNSKKNLIIDPTEVVIAVAEVEEAEYGNTLPIPWVIYSQEI